MNKDNNKRKQVKTGEKFGLEGWWVCKNLNDPNNPLHINDPEDKVSGGTHRLIYVYFGNRKPTIKEMESLIRNTTFTYTDQYWINATEFLNMSFINGTETPQLIVPEIF